MNITFKEQAVLNFVRKYILSHGLSPTTTEIAEGIGIKSKGVAYRYLKGLAEQGLIEMLPNKKRNIRLLVDSDFWQEDGKKGKVPVIGKIAAGEPIEALPDDFEIDLVHELSGSKNFVLQVSGDSMIGDNICDGDYIICSSTNRLSSNDIAVVLLDKEYVTLKRCKMNSDNTIALIPSNPDFEIAIYHPSRIYIQGKYIGLLRLNK